MNFLTKVGRSVASTGCCRRWDTTVQSADVRVAVDDAVSCPHWWKRWSRWRPSTESRGRASVPPNERSEESPVRRAFIAWPGLVSSTKCFKKRCPAGWISLIRTARPGCNDHVRCWRSFSDSDADFMSSSSQWKISSLLCDHARSTPHAA